MTLQPVPSGFPYIWGKFYFLFYQCTHLHAYSNEEMQEHPQNLFLQNILLQNVLLQTSFYKNVLLQTSFSTHSFTKRSVYQMSFIQNILFTKYPVFKTSLYKTFLYNTSLEAKVTKHPFTNMLITLRLPMQSWICTGIGGIHYLKYLG